MQQPTWLPAALAAPLHLAHSPCPWTSQASQGLAPQPAQVQVGVRWQGQEAGQVQVQWPGPVGGQVRVPVREGPQVPQV